MSELVASSAAPERARRIVTFAELDTGGKRIHCPHCHVAFVPHLGNWMAVKFQCNSCKIYLTFRNSPTTTTCPCCTISRTVTPLHHHKMILCGGCNAEVIYQMRDQAVKCYLCSFITIPPLIGARPALIRLRNLAPAPTAETESTASSSIAPKPETISVDYSGDSVSEIVTTNKREVEEDKTEDIESKKIRP